MPLPSEEQINTKAVELGLADGEGEVLRQHRSRVASVLMQMGTDDEQDSGETDDRSSLISRTTTKIDGGFIVVDVMFVTN